MQKNALTRFSSCCLTGQIGGGVGWGEGDGGGVGDGGEKYRNKTTFPRHEASVPDITDRYKLEETKYKCHRLFIYITNVGNRMCRLQIFENEDGDP